MLRLQTTTGGHKWQHERPESGVRERYDTAPAQRTIVRFYDETKAAIKSTEFYAYLVTFAGILIAAQVISDGDSGTGRAATSSTRTVPGST